MPQSPKKHKCKACGLEVRLAKAPEFFHRHSRYRNGFRSNCIECHRAYTRRRNVSTVQIKLRALLRGAKSAGSIRKVASVDAGVSAESVFDLLASQGGRCAYCRTPLDGHNVSIDHKVPRKTGGGKGLDNLQLTCKMCNYAKHSYSHEEFEDWLDWIANTRSGAVEETEIETEIYLQ